MGKKSRPLKPPKRDRSAALALSERSGAEGKDQALFQRAKLSWAVWIVALGMAVALGFHFWQAKVNGLGYPWNSFLYPSSNAYRKDLQFSDFWDCLQLAASWDPFAKKGNYFPFFYVAFYPFTLIPPKTSLVVFFLVTLLGFWWILYRWLRPLCVGRWGAWLGSGVLLFGSYPVIFCIDRGNIETGMALLVGLFIVAYQRKHYWCSGFLIAAAAAFKLTPVVFLSMFLRRRMVRFIFPGIFWLVLLTFGSVVAFKSSVAQSVALWQATSAEFTRGYLIYTMGLSWSSTLWNPIRCAILFGSLSYGATQAETLARLGSALGVYSKLVYILSPIVGLFVAVVETSFWRRIAILILFMTVAPPPGGDYKMIHVLIALVGLVSLRTRRRYDLTVVILLSLVLIPKKYWFFPGIVTDSLAQDASIGMIVNPLLMVLGLVLLLLDGWKQTHALGRKRRFYALLRGWWRVFVFWKSVRPAA